MITKIFKIILFSFFLSLFNSHISYAKNVSLKNFNEKYFYNYFSALVASDNNKNLKSLKFFNTSKDLKESHQFYVKKYIYSLIQNGKIDKAIHEIKILKNKEFLNFFEAQLLLLLDSLKKKDYKKSTLFLKNLKTFKEVSTFEFIISSVLEEFVLLFNNNSIQNNLQDNFGKLSLISRAFQSCYLNKSNADVFFETLVDNEELGYSRYLFFYINYLLSQGDYQKALQISQNIDPLNSTLLVSQTKDWLNDSNFKKIEKIFSCKNSNDIIGEIFFVIANLYASENYLNKSNFYFNISKFFNPNFKYNLTLIAENYIENNNFEKSKKILNNFSKKDKTYHWYKIKKISEIINKESNSEKSFKYIKSEFNKITDPSLKMFLDMGNIVKGFKKYDLSIKYYSKVLSELEIQDYTYSNILYRRGGSYERIGNIKKSDEDLLKSLELNPNEPHVLNYLAYSWLERNYKINDAIRMLEKAYEQRKNDPYIIDSIGWAYYLTGDYIKAEKLLKRAVEIMPLDPIVNDHYGDILWELDRKIQANYFWKNVLNFEDTETSKKEEIYYKILKGPKKI